MKKAKEYNARGERMYENPIKREMQKNKKNKQKQDEKHRSERECSSRAGR